MTIPDHNSPLRQAQLLYEAGFSARAFELLEPTLADQPHDGRAWELLGIILHALQDLAAAIRALETATSLVPLSDEGQLTLADCYSRVGTKETARCIYRFVALRGEVRSELLPMLAAGLGRLGEFNLAVNVCRRATQEEPDNPEPLFGLAYYLGKLGSPPERLLPLLRRAFELSPNEINYRVSLATVTDRLGDRNEAYRLLSTLERDDVGELSCLCCLQRMAIIFADVQDLARANWCRQRLYQLAAK